jgi:hypothetical protein
MPPFAALQKRAAEVGQSGVKRFGPRAVAQRAQKQARELRAAISPLPPPRLMPAALQKLRCSAMYPDAEWAADVVRALTSAQRLAPADRNDLGCAYAILAWAESSDEHWLRSIADLRVVRDDPDADEDQRKIAAGNLEAVAKVSEFRVDGVRS